MKTTLELPDELFVEAKAAAARRRITLKTLFTRALERELRPVSPEPLSDHFETDADGWPLQKRNSGAAVVVSDDFVTRLRNSEGV